MALLSEKRRFLTGIGLVLISGFTLVASLAFVTSRDSIRTGIAEQSLPLTSDNIYSEIQKDLLRPVFISSMMAHDTFVRDWIVGGERDTTRISRYLDKIRSEYSVNEAFLVSEPSRNYYLPRGKLKQVTAGDPRDRWYFRVRELSTDHEVNLDPDEANHDTLTIFVNFRLLGEDGRFLGATGVALTLDTIAGHIDRYEGKFQRRIYFVDRQGTLVLAGKSMAGHPFSIRSAPGIATIADTILGGDAAPLSLEYDHGHGRTLVNSRYIPELGSYLIVEQSEDGATDVILRSLWINLAASLVFSLAALLLMHRLARRYQHRIQEMGEQALANAARETELARSQQDFVAMVSHEFGTPLAIIDSSLQGLKPLEDQLPAEAASRYRKIQRATLRLRELMGNFLADDRLRQDEAPPSRQPVDIFALARRVAERAEWPELNILLPPTSAPVAGDSDLLRIVFFNLLNNAIKYSAEGGRIEVSGSIVADWAEISIRDEGSGIAAADLPHVFDRYFRAGNNRAGGTGLGLYIVRKIVTAHGGTVTADSAANHGSRFTVRLPLAPTPLV